MKLWHRIILAILLGLVTGVALAVTQIRAGLGAGQIRNGPWMTARTFGTKDASALVRAQVALSGLLALPAKEAMYFTAKTDSAGLALSGRCTYKIFVPEIPARWWSITAYEGEGWLIPNEGGSYSVGSAWFEKIGAKFITVEPGGIESAFTEPGPVAFISTGNSTAFDLTLRAYHPSAKLMSHPEKAVLPTIERVSCE